MVTTYTYDTQTSELTDVTYSDSTPALAFTYNRLGQQATITDATGTRSFVYDPATLQLTAENLDATFYDGLVLTRQYEDGNEPHGLKGRTSGYSLGTQPSPVASATYSYTEQGRLHTITDGTDTFTYDYKTNSNLLASMEGPVHAVSYSYEPNRDLMSSIDNKAGNLTGSSISKYSYQHDALNRRTSRVQQGTAFEDEITNDPEPTVDIFDYNPRSEVIESKRYTGTDVTDKSNPLAPVAFGYEYDPIGNRIQSSTGILPVTDYTTNSLNQYTLFGVSGSPREPKHDKDGNLTESGDGWFYKWDAENRLIEAYSFVEDKKLVFSYDYMSRRVEKVVRVLSTSTILSEERYLYDGWNPIFQTSNLPFAIETTKSFLWGLDLSQSIHGAGGVGGLLSVTEHAGTHQGTYVCTYDANGNVGQVLNSTGATVAQYEYDPFGNIINQTGTYADANTFRFSTKYFDVETGLYYYGYRYLDPETGRWLNRDPIEEWGGLNLYAFVLNDPVNWWDYLGLSANCCGGKQLGSGQQCCQDQPISSSKECCSRQECRDRAKSRYNSCITGCRYAGRTVRVLGRVTTWALATTGVGAPAALISVVVTQATSRTVVRLCRDDCRSVRDRSIARCNNCGLQ